MRDWHNTAMDGIGFATSAMLAARTRLDIATDNLANASSDGFRKHTARGSFGASGAQIDRIVSDEQGSLRKTGRPFDLALVGPGSFVVRDGRGITTATRSGAFSLDRSGHLCDDAGRMLLGSHGHPVLVPPGATIAADGAVYANGKSVDQLPLPSGTSVQTGFLENSNVNPIGEMVDMLTAQRSFESAQKVMSTIDSVAQKNANDVARLK